MTESPSTDGPSAAPSPGAQQAPDPRHLDTAAAATEPAQAPPPTPVFAVPGFAGMPGNPGADATAHGGAFSPAQATAYQWQKIPPPPLPWEAAYGAAPEPMRRRVAVAALITAIASARLLGAGYGFNIVILACLCITTAALARTTTDRSERTWSLVWAGTAIALLCFAAWRGEHTVYVLDVVIALLLGSLAVHGGRRWIAVLTAPLSLLAVGTRACTWAVRGTRQLSVPGRTRARNTAIAVLAALVVFTVFGLLFAAADPVFKRFWDSFGAVLPKPSPVPFFLFAVGSVLVLLLAYGSAAPMRWDTMPVKQDRIPSRALWLTPPAVLAAMFVAFDAIQVSVLFGGYHSVLRSTGMSYADYARQGFWELIIATALTLAIVAAAIRWSPRGRPRDPALVSTTLCALCVLAIVVVGSALRRMQMDMNTYGLSLHRVEVTAVEIWLGLLFLLLIAARCRPGTAWLPRITALSVALVLCAYTAVGPGRLVAEVNVDRYLSGQYITPATLCGLPADAQADIARLPVGAVGCAVIDSPAMQ